MNSLRKMMFVGLMMVIALVAAACGGSSSGGGSPDGAAKGLMESMFAGNVDDAKQYVCNAQIDAVSAETFPMPEGMNVDISGLKYETTSEEGDSAVVTISGVIKISSDVEGQDISQDVDVSTLGFAEVPMVREGGDWKVCDPTLGQ